MKILVIKDVPGEIKAQKMTYNIQEIGLAVALRKKGHECDVMCVSDDGQYHEQHIDVERQQLTIFSMKAFVTLKNGWLKEADDIIGRYDIIQACEYNQMYTWHLAKKYRGKMVCYHGPYYCDFNHNYNRMAKVFDTLFLGRYIKLNTPFITKSDLAADYLRKKGLNNVNAIGVGLSPTLLVSAEDSVLQELKAIEDIKGLKLLYIGAIEPRRNALFLLDILKSLKDDGIEVTLVLIGKYKDVDYQSQFVTAIKEYNLKDAIFYIPRVEQKYLGYVYKNCDIFLLPTIYDIYGMVLLEAMYYGIPTLTTVNGGSNMMLKDGENGYVFGNFNLKSWTDRIKKLATDKHLSEEIGGKAHDTIVNEFTWDALADKFIEEYKNILK
jgi:glycosyltransferase involved in cell wall biosynthesis